MNAFNHIYLYQFDGMEMKYKHAIKTRLPDGITDYCYKAVSETAIFLQHDCDEPTHRLHKTDLHHMGNLHHKSDLRGIVHPGTLVYGQKRGDEDWIIILHEPGAEMILQPPDGRKWKGALSVCTAGTKYVVVVERHTKTMDIFSPSGNTLLLLLCMCSHKAVTLITLSIRFISGGSR